MMPSRGGRPPFEPTDEQRRNVEIMVGLGIPQDSICVMIRDKKDRPITAATLRKRFKKEIAQGQAKLNATVGNFMVATILGRDRRPASCRSRPKIRASFAELFARNRMGWQTTVKNEIANADKRPFVYMAYDADANI